MRKILLIIFVFASISVFTQNNWVKTYSQVGNCYISFPVTPKKDTRQNTAADLYGLMYNNSLMMFMVENYSDGNKKHNDSDVHNESLLPSLEGLFEDNNGKIISHKKAFYKGRKALDFYLSIDFPGTNLKFGKGRWLIENGIVYIVIYYYSNFDQTEYNRFINSLDFD